MEEQRPIITILGGTGNLGSGLGWRFAMADYAVVIGSRSAEKAARAAQALSERTARTIRGMENHEAASVGDVVVLAVPFASHRSTLESIRDAVQGKILVDATVPLAPPQVTRVQLPPEGCVAKQSQAILGNRVRVVSAFQNVAAHHLQDHDGDFKDCDVLVTGNDADAREIVVGLANAIGLRAWHAGPIDNSVVAETLTSVLIFLNKRYKLDGAGIQITSYVRGTE